MGFSGKLINSRANAVPSGSKLLFINHRLGLIMCRDRSSFNYVLFRIYRSGRVFERFAVFFSFELNDSIIAATIGQKLSDGVANDAFSEGFRVRLLL